MNTTKKIVVALAVMMVAAAMAAPAAMGADTGNAAYSATVHTGQDTSVSVTSAAFGDILRGSTHTINPSFNLTNNGDWDASVDAKFLNASGGTYGMTNATEALVIPAASFSLNVTGCAEGETAMLNTDNDAEICSELNYGAGAKDVAAKLVVPDNQAADTYTGTIRLTFSNTESY
ncbi:MAG: hypothetical protein KAT65_23105 [Methanophagales archaeon]|nr:hypothetical protein [Methanophagales archaeon]